MLACAFHVSAFVVGLVVPLTYAVAVHSQINAVSLYLLYLVEMISSGLQIVYNTDEVRCPRVGPRPSLARSVCLSVYYFLSLVFSFIKRVFLNSDNQILDSGYWIKQALYFQGKALQE